MNEDLKDEATVRDATLDLETSVSLSSCLGDRLGERVCPPPSVPKGYPVVLPHLRRRRPVQLGRARRREGSPRRFVVRLPGPVTTSDHDGRPLATGTRPSSRLFLVFPRSPRLAMRDKIHAPESNLGSKVVLKVWRTCEPL